MKKNLVVLICASFVMSILLTGCGSSSSGNKAMTTQDYQGESDQIYYDNAYSDSYDEAATEEAAATDIEGSENLDAGAVKNSTRKLIKNVNMSVETEEYDTLIANVSKKIDSLGGYIENSDMGKSGYGDYSTSRYANITARIPAEKTDQFVQDVSDNSNVLSKTESIEDVTLQYVDVDSHKKALEAEENRLLELLKSAEDMEDIITIESKLSDIRYQIESYTSTLRTYDNQVDYSTISIYISEVQILTPVEDPGMASLIASGFYENIKNIKNGVRSFVIWFVITIPYFILLAILGGIAFVIYRKISRYTEARYEKKRAEKLARQAEIEAKKAQMEAQKAEKEVSKAETVKTNVDEEKK